MNAPDRIWAWKSSARGEPNLWSPDKIKGTNEYVRADIASAEIEKILAEADLLRAAFRINAIRWNPDISHAEIDKFVEKVASGDKVLL